LLLYYITDRKQFSGDESSRRAKLLSKIAEAARAGVDFVQLREKDLSGRELELLAAEAVRAVRENSSAAQVRSTKLLINSRTDVALACGADGVHLPVDDISPEEVRSIWAKVSSRSGSENTTLISVACHSELDVARSASAGADLALLAPIFEKHGTPNVPAVGLEALQRACRQSIRVLALGGITLENAAACMQAGAAGIAAIRLFQENEIAEMVRRLELGGI
jgi:thiamine-phosphate pyrophosphorylase